MSSVVFLRGVNVGGSRTFSPSALARKLAVLDVVSVQTAGTFVVGRAVSGAALRAAFRKELQFETELIVCTGREITDLLRAEPFPSAASGSGERRVVSIMARRLRARPRLPIIRPVAGKWQVKIVDISGRFAMSLWRPQKQALLYPNAVVEKDLGVRATTRSWSTLSKVGDILLQRGRAARPR
jgi:uncharacterized protein (DUF1697 family)